MALSWHEQRTVGEQERLARLPEVTARYNANLKRLRAEEDKGRRPDPNCDHCNIAQQVGKVVYCGRCMAFAH